MSQLANNGFHTFLDPPPPVPLTLSHKLLKLQAQFCSQNCINIGFIDNTEPQQYICTHICNQNQKPLQ
jgi:hypothetical protein